MRRQLFRVKSRKVSAYISSICFQLSEMHSKRPSSRLARESTEPEREAATDIERTLLGVVRGNLIDVAVKAPNNLVANCGLLVWTSPSN